MDEVIVNQRTTTNVNEVYRGDDFTPPNMASRPMNNNHYNNHHHQEKVYVQDEGFSWGWLIFVFIVFWILLWLTFWISDAPWTRRDDGEQDVFKTGVVSFILAIILVMLISIIRYKRNMV